MPIDVQMFLTGSTVAAIFIGLIVLVIRGGTKKREESVRTRERFYEEAVFEFDNGNYARALGLLIQCCIVEPYEDSDDLISECLIKVRQYQDEHNGRK